MRRKVKDLSPDAPLLHGDHPRPVTRRDFIRQGLMKGMATVTAPSLFSLFANPREAYAALSPDLQALKLPNRCDISTLGGGKIPFICFDLAGGANIAGSNVLVGQGSQMDFLTTAGYNRLGLPGDMIPPIVNPDTGLSDFIDSDLGLAFHSDSAFLRGIKERFGTANWAMTNGAVIPARSENDTGNNPHNPMYAINRCGADGELLTLIGSRNSDSGGNSLAPADMIDLTVRPTKIDRPSDVSGLVDTGKLVGLLNQSDAVAVMEAIQRISDMKLASVDTGLTTDAVVKELVRCGYVKSADLVDRYGNPAELDVTLDTDIVSDAGGIFTQAEFDGDSEFRKAASVMKLVVNGYAGAGTITMGGYDYHTGDRAVGEIRDLRAGRCMGACLEYAARKGTPLMLYVFSDGSVASNGSIDNSTDGRGKGVWTGDNQSTAASFFLVYNPGGQPTLVNDDILRQQIGTFSADGSVNNASSPAANNVNLLVQTVALNYLALHGEQGNFTNLFGTSLGNSAMLDSLTVFNQIQ
jgi:hypothetical protein